MPSMLPKNLEAFFQRATRDYGHLYQPSWLLNSYDDSVWKINFDSGNKSGHPQFLIRWGVDAPHGRLSTSQLKYLERQEKVLFLTFIDADIAPSRTEENAGIFKRAITWLSEFWVLRADEILLKKGIASIDFDSIIEFIYVAQVGGLYQVLDIGGRWDAWLASQMAKMTEADLNGLEAKLSMKHLNDIEQSLSIYESQLSQHGVSQEEKNALRKEKVFLAAHGAYDDEGFVSRAFLANTLGIGARRLTNTPSLQMHLRKYALTSDFSRQNFRRYGVRTERLHHNLTIEERFCGGRTFLIETLAAGVLYVSRCAALIPDFVKADIARTRELSEAIAAIPKQPQDRTPTIPVSTMLRMIREMLNWIANEGKELVAASEKLSRVRFPLAKGRPSGFERSMNAYLNKAEIIVGSSRIKSFWGHARKCRATWVLPQKSDEVLVGFSDMLDNHLAVIFCLCCLFSCSRRSEIQDLTDSDLVTRGERDYLRVTLRKRGTDGVRLSRDKPIPRVVAEAIRSQIAIRSQWLRTALPRDGNVDQKIFWRLTRSGIALLDSNAIYHAIDLMCEAHSCKAPNGRMWYIRPHQLRKSFAMTFFHFGEREAALPALSWLMGHDSIEKTWQYVRNQLTGSEISASEAAMATLAVYSADKTQATNSLRALIKKHFGVEDLSVMDEEEVQDYLEMLHEERAYTARPIEIRTDKGVRISVLIHIKRNS